MSRIDWRSAQIPENETGEAWELYHENSKTSRYDAPLTDLEVRQEMAGLLPSLLYEGYPTFALPGPAPVQMTLSEAIVGRHTARIMQPCRLSMPQLSALLHYSYGQTRDLADQGYPRPFRVVPSGGALYPLEIYFFSSRIEGLAAGLYHYSPAENVVHLVRPGDESRNLSEALVQRNLALDAAVMFFITGLFSRSTFKYRERGYRFALLEAGHVAQNLNLVGQALGLGVVNIGGFIDRDIDALLMLDGLVHSTLYVVAVGRDGELAAAA